MAPTNSLNTYLQDHLAGAAAGAEIAQRLADEYPQPPLATFLADLARDIKMDKTTLETIMADLDVSKDMLKQALGWVAERASRLKLGEVMTRDPDLRQLMEFEILSMGIEGKASLWRSLEQVSDAYPALAEVDLAGLQKRAQLQREGLEEYRLAAARAAFAGA